MRQIIAVASDEHCGHKKGLLNPKTFLWGEGPDGEPEPYKPNPTETQKVLWKQYTKGIRKAVKWADGDEIVFINNGDATWGKRYSAGLVSTRMADQLIIAADCFSPWVEAGVSRMRFVSGTDSHAMYETTAELLIAREMRKEFGVDATVVHHALIDFGGATFDVAHHGPGPGSRAWLRGNIARRYLTSIMMLAMMAGEKPPDIVLRSHYHTYVRETRTIGEFTSTLIITPSYCGLTEYARQVTRSVSKIGFGTILFEVIDGRVRDIKPLVKEFDLRRRESM